MFPLFPVLSAVAIAVGSYCLYWYESLTKEEKREADKLATEYAKMLYGKGLHQLTKAQFDHISGLVKANYA